jgi:hypothetical protein
MGRGFFIESAHIYFLITSFQAEWLSSRYGVFENSEYAKQLIKTAAINSVSAAIVSFLGIFPQKIISLNPLLVSTVLK